MNKLNSRTPIKKVWDMIRNVSGKNKKSVCVHIKSSNGNKCYSTKEISNALGFDLGEGTEAGGLAAS